MLHSHPADRSEALARLNMKKFENDLKLKYPAEFEHFLTFLRDRQERIVTERSAICVTDPMFHRWRSELIVTEEMAKHR